jgi:hypothetical protein
MSTNPLQRDCRKQQARDHVYRLLRQAGKTLLDILKPAFAETPPVGRRISCSSAGASPVPV